MYALCCSMESVAYLSAVIIQLCCPFLSVFVPSERKFCFSLYLAHGSLLHHQLSKGGSESKKQSALPDVAFLVTDPGCPLDRLAVPQLRTSKLIKKDFVICAVYAFRYSSKVSCLAL